VWQIALAARLSKYGISLHDALWVLPAAVLNQLLVYDELAAGNQPRWADSGDQGARDLEALMVGALTPGA
jgi:hypothetical protein